MTDSQSKSLIVPDHYLGERFDRVVAELCPEFSRSQLQKWIKTGHVLLNNSAANVRDKVNAGDTIHITPILTTQTTDLPEYIELDIVYEDEHLLVINKPAGLVVHPGAGNQQGTLVNGLLAYASELENLPRAGIVHRLDKDTSGLMVIAKTLQSHTHLINQFQQRLVKKEYLALVSAEVIAGSTIEANIGRHSRDRKKMAVKVTGGGKEAITHYRVEQRLLKHTLLRVGIETGRTHQIRVHLAWKHMPIVGDKVYGGRVRVPANLDEDTRFEIQKFNRQALHATKLTIEHPDSSEILSWESHLPDDINRLVKKLAQ